MDYRNAALQFSFQPSQSNRVVIQVNHQRVGNSLIATLKEDIELDWGILEHRLNNKFIIRAGRILLPLGIYNQMRDVGILLPFYSVPFTPYGDGGYTSETVDGMSLTYYREVGENGSIETEVYFGQWKWKEWYLFKSVFGGPPVTLVDEATIRNAVGGWLWYDLGFGGLRLGTGGFVGNVEGGIQFQEGQVLGPQQLGLLNFALDFVRERYYIRGEVNTYRLFKTGLTTIGGYGQIGFNITERLELNLQSETTQIRNLVAIPNTPAFNMEYNKDHALGLKFNATHFLSFKLEGHLNQGFVAEEPILDIRNETPFKTRYLILSLSVGF